MPLPPLPSLLIQVQIPYMEFGLIIPNIMEGEVLFHFRDPSYWVGSIKFMYVNFGNLIPRVWITPRGVGGMIMHIIGMLRILCIGIYLLTFCEWMHGFTYGCMDCYREGVVDFCLYGRGDEVHSFVSWTT
jgi:hypothetical protein